MNCTELAYRHASADPGRTAIWMPGGRSVSFGDLFDQAGDIQQYLLRQGVRPGHVVLLVDGLGPRLYAAVLGILGMGCTAALVEPWMPVSRIEEVVRTCKPEAFLASLAGKIWGWRVASIRRIPRWLSVRSAVDRRVSQPFILESMDGEAPAILTFTSGTTGRPKGVVRSHRLLIDQHSVLEKALDYGRYRGSDLCIFANFTLANLASGRTTLLLPPAWKAGHLAQIDRLPASLQPDTLTCGPAFLLAMMRHARVPGLKSIHVGGALCDCWIFEEGFALWPEAHWAHIYGSTEAEPVAVADAREAVAMSRGRGLFQTLYVGRPIDDVQVELEDAGLWVAGPHVCPAYIGDEEANRANKRRDAGGRTWHFMGDRIRAEADGLWYGGRSNQEPADFDLEQRIYADLQSSKSFIHHTVSGARLLAGEVDRSVRLPGIDGVVPLRIYRDRRHKARIDRQKSIARGAKWLTG